jgi:superfamily I DNA/RNA helicase
VSPRLVAPDQWRPVGVEALEPNAWEAVRSHRNSSVTAGPGAGKTEFLAQRAAYLLQTGLCPPPYRILAISYKRSSAKALADRVRARCSPELGRRFESWTFDGFAKGLVDRFRHVIPSDWRPPEDYTIAFPQGRTVSTFLNQVQPPNPAWTRPIRALKGPTFESVELGEIQLHPSRPAEDNWLRWIVLRWWDMHAKASPSALTFTMVNRLADLLLRTSPQILRLLRAAYPFVFVDEFQDTTFAQYGLLKTAFHGCESVITVVGDDKQRIMTWAGAKPDAFASFSDDFDAQTHELLFNYRSSPELVRLQHAVATMLEPTTSCPESKVGRVISGDAAAIWTFPARNVEATRLAEWIRADCTQRGLVPRDYAIVARQLVNSVYDRLVAPFSAVGLRLRNETLGVGKLTIQDVMSEPLTNTVLAVLEIVVRPPAPSAWLSSVRTLTDLRGATADDEVRHARIDRELSDFVHVLRTDLDSAAVSPSAARAFAERVIAFLSPSAIAGLWPEYQSGDYLSVVLESLLAYMGTPLDGAVTWSECCVRWQGVDDIPLLTIHRSKGQEYDTVIFVDLDDAGWRYYRRGGREDLSTFFVALSRARQRVVFSYCKENGRVAVGDLYDLLTTAGVPERAW